MVFMDYQALYDEWLTSPCFDEATKAELRGISEEEKKDRFYTELEFGTAGLRGVIGAGLNRMNIYTVRKATQGLANYIIKAGEQKKGVAIAYDSRRMSQNLPRKQHFVWLQMALKHICLNLFARHQSFHLL